MVIQSAFLFVLLTGLLAACAETPPPVVVTTPPPGATTTTGPAPGTPPALVLESTTAVITGTVISSAETGTPGLGSMVVTGTAGGTTAFATPTPTGDALPPVIGPVTLWHAYSPGSADERALTTIVEMARARAPEAQITVRQVPYGELFTRLRSEAAGGDPDLYLAPNDNLSKQVRAGLLLPLDDQLKDQLATLMPVAVEGMTVDDRIYGIPESLKAVALYYNKAEVPAPPATTADLLKMVQGGKTIAINQNVYHNFGFFGAYGGELFDANGKVVADQTGFSAAMAFLQQLKKEQNAQFYTDGGKADAAFREGRADMIINGPWVMASYREALKERLAVAPMPAAEKPATPLIGVDGFYINKYAKNVDGAIALAIYLTSPEAAGIFRDVAGHIPADKRVEVADPLVQGFAEAATTGYTLPHIPELDNYWGPFAAALTAVLEEGIDPVQAVKTATEKANQANNKN